MSATKRAPTWLLLGVLGIAWSPAADAQDRRRSGRPRGAKPAAAQAKERSKPAAVPPKQPKAGPEGEAPDVQVEQSGQKKVYRIKTEFVVEGRIQKPNAFYVLQRSNINYEWLDLKQEFTTRILQSVRESPF